MSKPSFLTVALLLTLLAILLLSTRPAAAEDIQQKIDPRVLADTEAGQSTHFLVVLSEQADVSGANALQGKEAKGNYVTERLREVAARTQPAVTSQLDALGVAYRTYWVTNMIAVEGDRALVEGLAANQAVAKIEPNRATKLDELESTATLAVSVPHTPTWGLIKIGAPDVWAMGFTGQGIVIANQDTGHQWDHPALINHYRGWNGSAVDHNYQWWDAIHGDMDGNGTNPCGFNLTAPCDDHGHGTHTLGTNVGDDGAGNQIGVAPGAKWISCRNMEAGTGRPSTYSECFQFFMAPTDLAGNNPTPALAPDVVSNSWGCPLGPPPSGEDCMVDSFRVIIENMRAAGIAIVTSAGNNGSACSTVLSPPAYIDAAITVGATNSNDDIAGFSSRGPVTADGSNRIKPDISAPGVSVRSSYPGNSYTSINGTSMASPHVAGAIALLLSARPALQGNVDAIESALLTTATPRTTTQTCGTVPGSSVPNNTFGYGRLNILAAVNSVPTAVTVGGIAGGPTAPAWLALLPLALVAALGLLVVRRQPRA